MTEFDKELIKIANSAPSALWDEVYQLVRQAQSE
jgi:hypothetical protein